MNFEMCMHGASFVHHAYAVIDCALCDWCFNICTYLKNTPIQKHHYNAWYIKAD